MAQAESPPRCEGRNVIQGVLNWLWDRIKDAGMFVWGVVNGFVQQLDATGHLFRMAMLHPIRTGRAILGSVADLSIFTGLWNWLTESLGTLWSGSMYEKGEVIGRIIFSVVFAKFVISPTISALSQAATPALVTVKATVSNSAWYKGLTGTSNTGSRVPGLTQGNPGNATQWKSLGGTALKNYNVQNVFVKKYHLLGATGTKAKFNTALRTEAETIVRMTIRRGEIRSITDQGILQGARRFRIDLDAGSVIGLNGRRFIRIVIDENGRMWSAFPVH